MDGGRVGMVTDALSYDIVLVMDGGVDGVDARHCCS